MKPTATPNQLLEGLTVGTQTKTHCEWCGHEFDEGDVAIVLFTQTADANRWEVHRIYCKACNPSTIARPVLDRAKLLVQCRLGTPTDVATQPTELVIFEPELIDSSEPAESGSAIVETDDVDSRPTPDESCGKSTPSEIMAEEILNGKSRSLSSSTGTT